MSPTGLIRRRRRVGAFLAPRISRGRTAGDNDYIWHVPSTSNPRMKLIMTVGNTVLPKATNNILKVYQLIQKHIDAYPGDAAKFPNFKQAKRPIFAKGAAGPLRGRMDLAEYFVSPPSIYAEQYLKLVSPSTVLMVSVTSALLIQSMMLTHPFGLNRIPGWS